MLADFVSGYYANAPFIPDEVLLPGTIAEDDEAPLVAWLRERKGKKVIVATPERGDRRKLVQLADRNAGSNFVTRRNKRDDQDQYRPPDSPHSLDYRISGKTQRQDRQTRSRKDWKFYLYPRVDSRARRWHESASIGCRDRGYR